MSHESELKFTFSSCDDNKLRDLLTRLGTSQGSRHLVNRYYDSTKMDLRRYRIGCRSRVWREGNDVKAEQTVKLAGTVRNGLHQRPEFNLPLEADKTPDLTLFPGQIWPEGVDISDINKQLRCVFEVTFTRSLWFVEWGHGNAAASIEAALDEGVIKAAGRKDAVYELELELKSGDEGTLEHLADVIMKDVELHRFDKSKAQRGYELLASGEA